MAVKIICMYTFNLSRTIIYVYKKQIGINVKFKGDV